MLLTACLLTRNEEKTVARAIHSVRGVADEILVADTASSDRTAAVAAEAGAAVTQFPWEDDFSAGRNELIGRATGDWILWIDAKEELIPESRDALKQLLTRADAFGFFLQVRHTDPDGGRMLGETADLRLFRRRPDLRFVGRLHPHFDPAVIEAVKREGLAVEPCGVVLRHFEERGRPSESKLRWTARLLELELRDRPGQLHYLIEQGRTLLLLKDPRGHEVMAAAAQQVAAAREAAQAPSAKVQVLLYYLLKSESPPVQMPLTAEDARDLALRWFPNSPALLWLLAERHFRAGEFEAAAGLLEQLIQLGKTGAYDRSQPFTHAIIGEQAILNLGACYLKLNRRAEAQACFLQILHSPTLGAAAARQLEAAR